MRVDWDPSNPAIQAAQGATLEVEDGKSFNRYPVEANVLRSGGLDYIRKTDDVLLTIRSITMVVRVCKRVYVASRQAFLRKLRPAPLLLPPSRARRDLAAVRAPVQES